MIKIPCCRTGTRVTLPKSYSGPSTSLLSSEKSELQNLPNSLTSDSKLRTQEHMNDSNTAVSGQL